jgi:hypothetical protein
MSVTPNLELLRFADLVGFVEQRLISMLRTPDAWGTPDAVELQVLLLLEVRLKAKGADDVELRDVQQRYTRFLAQRLPGPPSSLAERLGVGFSANARFVELLGEFVQSELGLGMMIIPLPTQDQSELSHYRTEA